MTESFYSPDNMRELRHHVRRPPEWLLLGGPADAREAQAARELWPGVRVVGVEPHAGAVSFQLRNGWPADCPLFLAGLSDRLGTELFDAGGDLRHGNLGVGDGLAQVITWDRLDEMCGPFDRAVLWLDVEGSELRALRGAARLLARGAVDLVNVEVLDRGGDRAELEAVSELLRSAGFGHVRDWNASERCRDMIWAREETL